MALKTVLFCENTSYVSWVMYLKKEKSTNDRYDGKIVLPIKLQREILAFFAKTSMRTIAQKKEDCCKSAPTKEAEE